MAISREHLLEQSGNLERREVHVPAWADENGDDVVIVRGMTTLEVDLIMAAAAAGGKSDDGKATARVVVKCMVEPRLTKDDLNLVANLGFKQIKVLNDAIAELSGMTDEAREALEGNSDAAPSGASSSSSPETSE